MHSKVVKMNLEVSKNGTNFVQKLPARNATNLAVSETAVGWAGGTADCGQGSADCVQESAGKTSTGDCQVFSESGEGLLGNQH